MKSNIDSTYIQEYYNAKNINPTNKTLEDYHPLFMQRNVNNDPILLSLINRCKTLVKLGFGDSTINLIKEFTSRYYTQNVVNGYIQLLEKYIIQHKAK